MGLVQNILYSQLGKLIQEGLKVAKNREDQPRLKVINERCMQFMVFFFSIYRKPWLGYQNCVTITTSFSKNIISTVKQWGAQLPYSE